MHDAHAIKWVCNSTPFICRGLVSVLRMYMQVRLTQHTRQQLKNTIRVAPIGFCAGIIGRESY